MLLPGSLLLLTCPASAGRAALRVLLAAPNRNQCWGRIYTSRGFGLHCAPSVLALAGWLELLGQYRSRQGKWQTGVALGQHQLQRERESSAPFPYTSLDPKTITLRGGGQTRARLGRGLLCPWAALVVRRQLFAAWTWLMGWLLLPGSAASLPLASPLAQAGTEPPASPMSQAGGSSDVSG